MEPRERVGAADSAAVASPPPAPAADEPAQAWPEDAETPPDEPSVAALLGHAPLLAIVSAFAALADVGCNRILVPMIAGHVDDDFVRWLVGIGAWPRNLAALAGLVALTIALVSYLRMRGYASMVRRLFVASFAGIFMPTVVLAIVMPRERTQGEVVIFATAAANILATLLASTSTRARAPVAWRAGAGLVGLATFCSLAWLTASRVRGIALTSVGPKLAALSAGAAELGYIAVLVLVAALVVPRSPRIRDRIALGVGVATLVASLAAFVVSWRWLRADFATVLYAAQRVDLLIDAAPLVYAVPIAVALGGGVAALCGADAIRRQAGAGLLLFTAAGCAPRSPGALLTMLLGAALISRAVLARAATDEPAAPVTTPRAPDSGAPPRS